MSKQEVRAINSLVQQLRYLVEHPEEEKKYSSNIYKGSRLVVANKYECDKYLFCKFIYAAIRDENENPDLASRRVIVDEHLSCFYVCPPDFTADVGDTVFVDWEMVMYRCGICIVWLTKWSFTEE